MAQQKTLADAGEPSSGDPIDTRLVRRLAAILKDTDLSEIEVERGDLRIRVARAAAYAAAPPAAVYAPPPPPPPPPQAASAPASAPARSVAEADLVKSPMVGTVYLQAQPGSPAFIKVGDKVTAGQTLLIVEAMKTMNPVPSPRAGVVAEILVEDSQPVEYGAPLVVLE
jgi:acetyl-CoA carboxylase biotin carboxyl carrier protein